ncbi:hypothetical protein GALMADRAFT_144466 [Galerina marginata CBS 339.88]|uniref:Uncharacterized protein n=1 Tax=Galerina marginata (strain CBS 339.88) TaxID=685588 RepID=A0A067SUW4_GALM3|nr:hypothetical protein GALMADRAFT_144466 [Galerina marginata CBS 339.88]
MFISKVFLTLFALLLSTALAAPAPIRQAPSRDDLQLSTRGLGQLAKAAGMALKIKKNLHPTPGKAVFWSGSRPGKSGPVSVGADAERFAAKHGKEVLNPSLQKHGINIPSRKESPYSNKLWGFASKVYAQRASGHVHAVLGSTRRPGNIYDTIEKPILMKNKKVTKITEHNAETGKATVVKGK